MYLEQEKLDVKFKKRSNPFNWRGQFTPEFVEYLLSIFAKNGDRVLDPFSGSGTVLLESARLGHQADGFEVNPSAYAMSKFFSFCNIAVEQRFDLYHSFESKLQSGLPNLIGKKVYVEDRDFRKAYCNLLQFASDVLPTLSSKEERILLLNVLFFSEKDKNLTITDSIVKSLYRIKGALIELPYSQSPIKAHLSDARSTSLILPESIDLIITSPPYINVFNYHQNYRAIIELFRFDILKVAQSEMGSNRKNRSNRFKTVVQYCLDMESAIRSFWSTLKPNATMIMVLGKESNVRGIPFYNGRLVLEIIENLRGFDIHEIMQRHFTNKFGLKITEDIIIAQKSRELVRESIGRNIAVSHLKENLTKTTDIVAEELREVILNAEFIGESPVFNSNQALRK